MKQQVLFKVTYCEEISPYDENEVFVLCDGYPGHKKLKKRLNMIDYCGKEMSNEDYQEFVVELGNHKKFNIESVEEINTIKFN